jgi:hypothetical protein
VVWQDSFGHTFDVLDGGRCDEGFQREFSTDGGHAGEAAVVIILTAL